MWALPLLLALLAACGDDDEPADAAIDADSARDARTDRDVGRPDDADAMIIDAADIGPLLDGGPPLDPGAPRPGTTPPFFVATDGSDDGDGSLAMPWATIEHAVDTVPDGATILVRPGTYMGRVQLDRSFATGVVVRSEVPYRARLRHDGTVVTVFEGQGITIEGFDIAHAGPGSAALVVQIQDLRGEAGGDDRVSRIVLRNNVLHDSYDNDILKINNGASDVVVEHNVFYNQAGSDEHIDINSVERVVVQDNVFFSDFEGSGRTDGSDTSSFIVVKDSNATDDTVLGSRDITIRRNVFLHYQGSTGTSFLLLGEDGMDYFEVDGAVIENNLFLGDSASTMRAAFGVKGCRDVLFRNNTIVGDLPSLAFAFRLNREGSNPPLEEIRFFNNVWSDPTGTMDDFSDSPPGDTASAVLDRNLYWNGGSPLPDDDAELLSPSDDARAVIGDPQLATPTGVVLPRWDETSGMFADGSGTACMVRRMLAQRWAFPTPSGAGVGAADPANAPGEDILGRPRSMTTPTIGAMESP